MTDHDKPWRLPDAKPMTFDEMTARAQYWYNAALIGTDEIAELREENERLRKALRWIIDNPSAHRTNMVKVAEAAYRATEGQSHEGRAGEAAYSMAARRPRALQPDAGRPHRST